MHSRIAPRRRSLRSAGVALVLAALAASLSGLTACGGSLATQAVDQASAHTAVPTDELPEIAVPAGFRAVRVVAGLTYPSSMTWDREGRLYVLESHTVPLPLMAPRIVRIDDRGDFAEVKLEGDGAPTGEQAVAIEFHDGWIYLTHEEKDGTWGLSRVRPEGGAVEAVLRGLPGDGDHWPNYMVFDRRGNLYFGVGSATNSGVVSSKDPVNMKWLKKRPQIHDRPCRDLTLTGQSFTDDNQLTDAQEDTATTGAFQPYGTAGATRIPGSKLCNGAVYRLAAGAREPEVVAWGFRNPVALAMAPDGTVLVGMHGADIRGTRPILDDVDAIYRLREGAWYGWPDFAADLGPMAARPHQPPAKYLAKGHTAVEPLIDLAASRLAAPDRSLLVTALKPHAALGGMAVVPARGPFAAWANQLLVSEMGDFRPSTDPSQPDVRAGFQVEAVDLKRGTRKTFARNRGAGDPQPASKLDLENGLERPVDVKIGPDGNVYILDFGVFEPTEKSARVLPKTGKVFRVEPLPR